MKNSNSLWVLAFQKFKQNKLGLACLVYIVLCGLVAVFCHLLAPDNSNSANQMHLEIHSKAPGFNALLLQFPTKQTEQTWISKFWNGKQINSEEIPIKSYQIKESTLEIIKYSDGLPKSYNLSIFKNQPEKFIQQKTFYFGTDKYGRDLLSRLLIGLSLIHI